MRQVSSRKLFRDGSVLLLLIILYIICMVSSLVLFSEIKYGLNLLMMFSHSFHRELSGINYLLIRVIPHAPASILPVSAASGMTPTTVIRVGAAVLAPPHHVWTREIPTPVSPHMDVHRTAVFCENLRVGTSE